MNTYNRTGQFIDENAQDSNVTPINPSQNAPQGQQAAKEKGVRIDGYLHVLEMLKVADEEFRQSLLLRIAKQDMALGQRLKKDLGY